MGAAWARNGVDAMTNFWFGPLGGTIELYSLFSPRSFSPVLWLKLDDGSGTTPQDSSGNGNHATFVDTPTWGSGYLEFDGANDGLNVAYHASLAPEHITVMGWLWIPAAQSNLDTFIARAYDGTTQPYYAHVSATGSMDFGTFGASSVNVAGQTALPTETWVHVAATHSGSEYRIWRNAVSDGVNADTTALQTNTEPLNIGYLNVNGTPGRFLGCRAHDILIFPSALTQEQIAAVMAVTEL